MKDFLSWVVDKAVMIGGGIVLIQTLFICLSVFVRLFTNNVT